VLDDFSRYILARKLCTIITAADVTETLRLALTTAGLNSATVRQRHRLLGDNGPSYLSAQLSSWRDEHGTTHTRGQPDPPMTQGKIERYHRSLKNRILLEHYYLCRDTWKTDWPSSRGMSLGTSVNFFAIRSNRPGVSGGMARS
jgi:transposase InsO family protein